MRHTYLEQGKYVVGVLWYLRNRLATVSISVLGWQCILLMTVSMLNWNLETLDFMKGGKPESQEKNPLS